MLGARLLWRYLGKKWFWGDGKTMLRFFVSTKPGEVASPEYCFKYGCGNYANGVILHRLFFYVDIRLKVPICKPCYKKRSMNF